MKSDQVTSECTKRGKIMGLSVLDSTLFEFGSFQSVVKYLSDVDLFRLGGVCKSRFGYPVFIYESRFSKLIIFKSNLEASYLFEI